MSYRYTFVLGFILLLGFTGVEAGIVNTGLLISQANQDADLTLGSVPRNMTNGSDIVEIEWEPQVPGVLKYSSFFAGPEPQGYQNSLEDPIAEGDGFVRFRGDQLPVGYLFCIIDGGEEGYSIIFNIIRASSNAPEMIDPITGVGRPGIRTVTPQFRWRPIEGVPYYHLIVSDQTFDIIEDPETGHTRVEGANVIWQAITSNTSIQYGIPDPSGFFEDDNIPPLVGDTTVVGRPRYSWVVLNNYNNHPAYTSTVTGGVSGFEVQVAPPFEEPENIAPAAGSVITSDDIVFRWSEVEDAISYFIYVSREEITPGGSRGLVPAWNEQTTLTSIACPAIEILQDARYVWKVLAASQQGEGTLSDTTSFIYSISSGSVSFITRDEDNNRIEYVEILTETIEGPALLSALTNDNGFVERPIPEGRYRFYTRKVGYEEIVTDIITVEEDEEYLVTFEMVPLLSSIIGTVVDQENQPISAASVRVRQLGGEETETVETNISGEFQVMVVPGNWALTVSAAGYESSDEIVIEVEAGHNVDLNALRGQPIVLQEYFYEVSGEVTNPDGHYIGLATVTIENDRGEIQRTYTPEEGNYSFTVGAGLWVLNAFKPGFYLESGPVEVEVVNRNREVDFILIPQAGIVSGQVFVNGNPAVRDVEVWFLPDAGEVLVTRTNQIGTYSQGLSPGDYIVTPVLQGYHTEDSLSISVGPGETISGVRLDLTANPSSIAGRITNAANEPLPGASVSAGGVSGESDMSGNYRLSVAAGDHVVTAQRQGFVTNQRGPVAVEPGQDVTGINLRLVDNAGTITGRVRRGNDPIYDAVVTATRQDNDQAFTTRTDRHGEYSFGLFYGTYVLTVHRDGFIPAPPSTITVQLQPGQTVSDRNFAMLNYSGRILGTVSSNRGAINAPIIRVVQLDDPNRVFSSNGNIEGAFSVTVPPERSYIVTASKAGFSTARDTTEEIEVEGEVSLQFHLTALPCQLSGIVSVNDQPLRNATVRIEGQNQAFETVSNNQGQYRFDLESGEYHITASKPGYTGANTDVLLNPGENRQDVNLALAENFATVSGTIFDHENQPIEAVTVTLIDTVNRRETSTFTDGDGAFLFGRLIPSYYQITAEEIHYADGFLVVGVIVGGQQRGGLRLELEPLDAMIVGTVSADGEPVAGATIYASGDDHEANTISIQDGSFTLGNLAVGIYRLRPAKVGFTGIVSDDIDLCPGDTLAVELVMVRNDGQITGFVRDPDNVGLRDARVSCNDSLGNFAATSSNPDGSFAIINLYPESRYDVSVQLAGYSTDEDTIRGVAANSQVNFTMLPDELIISGRTINQVDTPLVSVPVVITSLADGSVFRTTSIERGVYRVEGLAANTRYSIETASFEETYTNSSIVIQTEVNHVENVDLELIESSAAISGDADTVEVSISAYNRQTRRTRTVYSQGNGSYRLSRMRDGDWVLRPSKVGFTFSPDSIVVADLMIDSTRTGINFSTEVIELSISGSVVDAQGNPVTEAPMLAWSQTGESRDTTDQDGDFLISELYPFETYTVTTVLPSEGYTNNSIEVPLELADRENVRIEIVRHNATLTGVVRRTGGGAIQGASVTLDGTIETVTNANGAFTFEFLGAGDHDIRIVHRGYISLQRSVNTGNGEGQYDESFTLEMLELAVYGAITLEEDATPIPGCVVKIEDDLEVVHYDTTGSNGTYSFNLLDPERTYEMVTTKKGHQPFTRSDIIVRDGSQQVNISLSRVEGALTGYFYDSDGTRIPNAPVVLQSFENRICRDTTDHAGDYVFPTGAGIYMLMAVHPDGSSGTSFNRNLAVGAGESIYLPLMLSNAGVIAGNLEVDQGGAPASAGYISARHVNTGDVVFNWGDQDGVFQLRGLRPGQHNLTVEASGYAMVSGSVLVEVTQRDTSYVTVIMTREGKAINGYITDQFEDPVHQAKVTIDGPTSGTLITNENGYYSLSGPSAGQYTVSVNRLGYASPPDTSFDMAAGDILLVNRQMEIISNAVSGYICNDVSESLADILVIISSDDIPVDSAYSDSDGGYIFEGLAPDSYQVFPEAEGYRSLPDVATITIEEGQSIQNLNFIMAPDRGYGIVNGEILHLDEAVEDATVQLVNLDDGTRRSVQSDNAGMFEFTDVNAPGTYRLRARLPGRDEVVGQSFSIDIDEEVTQVLEFPAGRITVNIFDSQGLPILGRGVQISGINVEFDTLLYTDVQGTASTLPWLSPGDYYTIPNPVEGTLPSTPRTVSLALNETVELDWYIDWEVTTPPPINFADSGRVEILIPEQVEIADANLFWLGPGSVEWESAPLRVEGAGFMGTRSLRSTENPVSDHITGHDEAVVYYGYIPPQNRGGILQYYLEVATVDGLIFGGIETIQEVQITREGLLDHLELTTTRSSRNAQIGVPIIMTLRAYDDGENDLTETFPADAFTWIQLDSVLGELEVDPDDPSIAVYRPFEEGPVRVKSTVHQDVADVTISLIESWTNKLQIASRVTVSALSNELESGGEITFYTTAYDSVNHPLDFLPRWEIDNELLGVIEPIPFSNRARFSSIDDMIGYVQVGVMDSLSGLTGFFNAETPDRASRGLKIYGQIQRGVTDTAFFRDGAGFSVAIPPDFLGVGSKIGLSKQILPPVMRLTTKYESPETGYDIQVETVGIIGVNKEYTVTLPIPVGFRIKKPEIGVWNSDIIDWEIYEGIFNADTSSVIIEVQTLGGLYTVITSSDPLGIDNMKFSPNPFSPNPGYDPSQASGVAFEFRLNSNLADYVDLSVEIYNMRGDLIRTLVDNEPRPKGEYHRNASDESRRIIWNGLTNDNRMARNGRYMVVVTAKDAEKEDRKVGTVVLIK